MQTRRINVTKSFLPPLDEYISYISRIWDNHYLTNFGPLCIEFEEKLRNYLKTENVHFVCNGTISLLLALDSLNITGGEVITTPFSFVATTSSIVWQRCKPIFVDIGVEDFNIDPNKIEEKITENTKAILAVHCFGIPCNVTAIQKLASKYNLPVIYDAAHSFGTMINGKSVLLYGDISSCSFHATKVFHTIEGGLCVVNNKKYENKMLCIKNFGNNSKEYAYCGINAKASEFNAAMGLSVFNHFDEILKVRKHNYDLYKTALKKHVFIPEIPKNVTYNYIYFPVVFDTEESLLDVFEALNKENIYPRRYFYPAINDIEYYKNSDNTPIAHDISKRIACLPLDSYINDNEIKIICDIIIRQLKNEVKYENKYSNNVLL